LRVLRNVTLSSTISVLNMFTLQKQTPPVQEMAATDLMP
jgi:hypothetical protein